jgi:hemoglobin-like flavoprotein
MFERYPAWEELFPAFKEAGVPLLENPAFQNHVQKNVMNTLSAVIEGMEDEDKVKKSLLDLGKRHIPRKVTREHFVAVTGLLLDTLRIALGPDFDPETEAAWKLMMDAAMSLMGDGAEGK